MTRTPFLLLALAACGSLPGGYDDTAIDAVSCCDAVSDAAGCAGCVIDAQPDDADTPIDSSAGRPQGSACDLLLEQCAAGLTCRYTGVTGTPFSCQPVGPMAAGAACVGTADCGANLGCFPVGGGQRACLVFCDTADPVRCQASETCFPQTGLPPEYPNNTGVCG